MVIDHAHETDKNPFIEMKIVQQIEKRFVTSEYSQILLKNYEL